jgi:ATP-binding cassette, subfamily C, bacterial exporter for protease/lipase
MVRTSSIWEELRVAANLRAALTLVLVFSLFVNLLILTSPIYMMQVYDRVLVTGQVETLLFLSAIVVVALIVLGLFDGVRGQLLTRLGRYLDVSLRDPVLINAIAKSRQAGTPSRRIIDDFGTMRGFLGSPAVLPFIDAPWAPFFIAVVFMLHPWLGVLAVVSAAMLVGLTLINDQLSRRLIREASSQQAIASEFAAQAVQNSEVVHAMGMGEAVGNRYRQHVEGHSHADQRVGDFGASFQAAIKAVRIAVQSAALGLGAYLVILGELTPGSMIAASIILGRALAPIEQGIGSWRQFVAARDAYRSVKEFLSGIRADETRMSLPELKGRVTVEDVTYKLPHADRPILKRISFTLEPGQVLALAGPSASGKSTLCRVLVGAAAPTIGSVRIDGAEVTALSASDVRRAIGYMPQTVELFAGTVKDNIARLGDVDEEAVLTAARLAGCHEMILRLDNGYETEIGPRGAFLSGGQRQRIGLARALYKRPRVLVLDEPNSNLDQEGEMALVEAIQAVKRAGVTVIVVNHRSTLLQPVDKLGLIRDGQLDRFGDRDDVLREMTPKKPTLVPVEAGAGR